MSRGRSFSVTALLSALSALSLNGCATQPEYRHPETILPDAWVNTSGRSSGPAALDEREGWWTELRDPAIDSLVSAALESNPTLAEVAARVDQARAIAAVGRAQRFPRVDVSASSSRDRVATAGGSAATETMWESSAAMGPNLSWESDLWGRLKENALAARRRLQARDADARDARLSIAAQVANGVLSLRACNLLLAIRDADIASREKELEIIRSRVRLGSLPPVDVAAAESNLATVRVDRIAQEESCLQTVGALVAISGRPADEVRSLAARPLDPDRGDDLTAQIPSAPAVIPDIPATVLTTHPSVVAAEREVAARWSEIAVARAERLPRLDLTAVLTGQWIRAFGSTDSLTTGSAALGLAGPLFDAGAGSAEVDRAEAAYREAVAVLIGTIRQAVRDIEDGLAAQDSAIRRLEVSRASLAAAEYMLSANEARRRAGSIGAFELEESRRQLNRAQESAIVAARDRAQAWVEIVRRSSPIVETTAALDPTAAAYSFGMDWSR